MIRFLTLFNILIFNFIFSQNIDLKNLTNQITKLNDEHHYEHSILTLEKIIEDKKSTHYDKYNAYLLKYMTYKRLYNYYEGLNNINLALEEGLKSDKKDEVEIRILIEKLFVNFDLQKYDEVDKLLPQIERKNIDLVNPETKAFYISLLGVLEERKNNDEKAAEKYKEAILILEKHSPKDLPNIYRKQLALYGKLNEHEKAMETFEKGLHYAKKYKTDIYIIIMYEALTSYYQQQEDWKNALFTQRKVSELRTIYDATNRSGKLNLLEKELLNKRNSLELRNEKNVKNFLAVLTITLSMLIFVLYKLNKVNKQKHALVENEMIRMRENLAKLTSELNDKGETKLDISKYDLTQRQLEIIYLVEQGKTNKEIGAELFISENTVKYHLKIIYNILGIDNRSSIKL